MNDSHLPRIEQDLQAGRVIVIDGATGTELERRGAAMHDAAWCAAATLSDPDLLRTVHEDYIRAGARLITTNTFSSNRIMLEPAGLGSKFEAINRQAVQVAQQARDASGQPVLVAGSMSHQVPLKPDTDLRDVKSVPPAAKARGAFEEMATTLADNGVDLLLLEMMSDPDLANPAIEAALATGLPVWVGLSVRTDAAGHLVSYARPDLSLVEMLDRIPLAGVRVAGIMHSSVNATLPAIEQLRLTWKGPLMAYPDSGFFKMPHWQFIDVIEPELFVEHAAHWADAGVQVLGGCCGLGVAHIRCLAEALRQRSG